MTLECSPISITCSAITWPGASIRNEELWSKGLGLFSWFLSLLRAKIQNMITRWFINIKHLFLLVLEARRSRLGCQRGQEKALFWVIDFLFYPQMAEEGQGLSGSSFLKALYPFMRALLSRPNHLKSPHLQNSPPPGTITGGVWFQHILKGCKHWDHSSWELPTLSLILGCESILNQLLLMSEKGTLAPVATTRSGNLHSSKLETWPANASFLFDLCHDSWVYVR